MLGTRCPVHTMVARLAQTIFTITGIVQLRRVVYLILLKQPQMILFVQQDGPYLLPEAKNPGQPCLRCTLLRAVLLVQAHFVRFQYHWKLPDVIIGLGDNKRTIRVTGTTGLRFLILAKGRMRIIYISRRIASTRHINTTKVTA